MIFVMYNLCTWQKESCIIWWKQTIIKDEISPLDFIMKVKLTTDWFNLLENAVRYFCEVCHSFPCDAFSAVHWKIRTKPFVCNRYTKTFLDSYRYTQTYTRTTHTHNTITDLWENIEARTDSDTERNI